MISSACCTLLQQADFCFVVLSLVSIYLEFPISSPFGIASFSLNL